VLPIPTLPFSSILTLSVPSVLKACCPTLFWDTASKVTTESFVIPDIAVPIINPLSLLAPVNLAIVVLTEPCLTNNFSVGEV